MHDLFQKARQGDPGAQRQIDDVIRRIARVVCARGGPGSVDIHWEDIAQDASRQFFDVAIHQFRKPGSEESFLYAIVRTTLLQTLRAASRRRAREAAAFDAVPMPSHDPGPAIDVRAILSGLDDECASLLDRVFLRSESYSALASELNILESSVRTKVSRCLRKAREMTQGESR